MTTGNQKFMKSNMSGIFGAKAKVQRRIRKRGFSVLDGIRQQHRENLARADNRIAFRREAARKLAELHAKK